MLRMSLYWSTSVESLYISDGCPEENVCSLHQISKPDGHLNLHATNIKNVFAQAVDAVKDIVQDMVEVKKTDFVKKIKRDSLNTEFARLGKIQPVSDGAHERPSLATKHELTRLGKIWPDLLCSVLEDDKEIKRLSKITPDLLDSNYSADLLSPDVVVNERSDIWRNFPQERVHPACQGRGFETYCELPITKLVTCYLCL